MGSKRNFVTQAIFLNLFCATLVSAAPQKVAQKNTSSGNGNSVSSNNSTRPSLSNLDDKLPKPVIPTQNGCDCARIFYPEKYLRLERKIFADCMANMQLSELQSEFLSMLDEIEVVVQTMDVPENMTRRDDLRCFLDTNRVHFRETAINKLLASQGTDVQESLWKCWGIAAELLDDNDVLMPETLVFDIREAQGPADLKADLMDDARRCGCKYYKPNSSSQSVTKLLGEYFLCAMEKCFV